MGPGFINFLDIWRIIMWVAAGGFLLAGLVTLFIYKIKESNLDDYKAKYDLSSRTEIKTYSRSLALMAGAIACIINTTYHSTVILSPIWFFVRLFISICFATLIYYIIYLIFKYVYPTRLNKKLRRYRYKPRISPDGNEMKLLREEEEDVHLDKGMQAEENVFSVDYDVWVDENSGYVKIEKYPGHLQALECNSCGFQTMKLKKEEIISHPTEDAPGQLIKHFECSYCGSKRHKNYRIAKITESDEEVYHLPENPRFQFDYKIDLIKLDIHTNDGEVKKYEFQNLTQVKQFLSELENENVVEQE